MKKVLVTGGAGFIGSHTVDLLLEKGYSVRIFDALEYPTHKNGKPPCIPKQAEFLLGDVRNVDDLSRALLDVDVVFHLAATGGFTPLLSRYLEVNAVGTANLLELIQNRKYPVKKIIVASSAGVYGEGKYLCDAHGAVYPKVRSIAQLKRRDWELKCPECGLDVKPVPTDEGKPPLPERAYSISKYAEERLVLSFGRDNGIPSVALRYFLTYGPRQSLTNPYTGVVSIFSSRILNGPPPLIYEDGNQLRDLIYVKDVARANVLVMEKEEADFEAFNVGTGVPTKIKDLAYILADLYNKRIDPEIPGDFRLGEARHMMAETTRLKKLGFTPEYDIQRGLREYLNWITAQGGVKDYFSKVPYPPRHEKVAHSPSSGDRRADRDTNTKSAAGGSLSILIPAYNEAGNLHALVWTILLEVERFLSDFEVVIIDDGSRDGTGRITDALAAENPRVKSIHHTLNIGYGAAQKTGFKHATKEWAILIPADHQFDIKDLQKFLEQRHDADLVGSRRIDRKDPPLRKIISLIYNLFMRKFYGVVLNDLNWVKMYRRSLFDAMDIELDGFGVDAEIVVKAQELGYRIKEVDVPHYPRTWGVPTGVKFKTLYGTAKELLRLRGMLQRMRKETKELSHVNSNAKTNDGKKISSFS